MESRHAALAYKDASIESAPPIQIVRLLYQGALRFLDNAAETDPIAERARFDDALLRADAVVAELRLALEHEQAPELTEQLSRLYLFIEERIRAALRERSTQPIGEARAILARLNDAWSQLDVGAAADPQRNVA